MRLLLDQNLPPLLVDLLAEAGHDVVHVQSLGMHAASDGEILQAAVQADREVVSADSGDLLASSNAAGPSVLLLRRQDRRRASELAALILANFEEVSDDLAIGANTAVVEPWRPMAASNRTPQLAPNAIWSGERNTAAVGFFVRISPRA